MRNLLFQFAFSLGLSATRSRYHRLARDIRRRQFWPPSKMMEWQQQQLARVIRHAGDHSSFYRQRFQEASFDWNEFSSAEDLNRIPITTKTDIQQHFPDGMTTCDDLNPDWRIVGTRGTTNRLMVIHDFARRDHKRAANLVVVTEDCHYRVGQKQVAIPPDACSSLCGVEGLRETSVVRHFAKMIMSGKWNDPDSKSDLRGLVMNNWIGRSTILEPFGPEGTHISEERLDRYLTDLKRIRPAMLKALPEYLQGLARHARATGRELTIPIIRPLGANLDAVSRRSIEACLGGQVREHYGSVEFGGMAFDCSEQCGMHVLSDNFLIEVVRDGVPVQGNVQGSILITDLHNFTMPMIRYEIGDIGRINHTPCRCGRTSPRLELEGRLEDTIVTQDQCLVTPEVASRHLFRDHQLEQFQLVESRSGKLELKYVRAGDNGTFDREQLQQSCEELFGTTRRIVLREVDTILPESSGKFRPCKSSTFSELLRSHSN